MSIVRVTDADSGEFSNALKELSIYFARLSEEKGRPVTFNLLTYGCQLNEADSEKLSGMLTAMGLTKSEDTGNELAPADVIVMNTCSVRENADQHLFGNLGVFKTAKNGQKCDHWFYISLYQYSYGLQSYSPTASLLQRMSFLLLLLNNYHRYLYENQ